MDEPTRYPETKAPCDWCGGSGEILEIRPTTVMGMDGEIVRVPCPQCSPAGGGDRITMAAHCRMAALEAIQAERARQLSEEGWSVEHDDRYSHGEIARAAAAYAVGVSSLWPWESRGVKLSSDRLRDLAKAGALIVAEMERLMRKEMDRGE